MAKNKSSLHYLRKLMHLRFCLSDCEIGERDEIKVRQKECNIKNISGEDIAENSDGILNWLKSCDASKVVIHFDMYVLDPAEIVVAVGADPNGLKMSQVIRIIN